MVVKQIPIRDNTSVYGANQNSKTFNFRPDAFSAPEEMVFNETTQKRWAMKFAEQLMDMGCPRGQFFQVLDENEAAVGLSTADMNNVPGYFVNMDVVRTREKICE